MPILIFRLRLVVLFSCSQVLFQKPIVTWSNKGIFSWIISPRMRSRLFDQISCFATLPPISSIFTPSRRSFTQNGKFQKEKWGKSCSFTRYELEHSLKANLPSTIQQRYPRMKYYYPPGSRLGLLYSALRKLWKIELRQANKKAIAHPQLLVRGAVALAVTGVFTNRRERIGISNLLL